VKTPTPVEEPRAPAPVRGEIAVKAPQPVEDDWLAFAGPGGGGPPDGGGSGDSGGSDGSDWSPRERKPRLRKLRFLAVLVGLALLALVSMVFGMLMAVASDIPQLENFAQYRHQPANSYLYDDRGKLIGILEPPTTHAVFDTWKQISPSMIDAVIAVEDKRFWSEPGIDLRGIGRAVLADVTGGSRQGASTITEQFVKNALAEQDNRTVFEKLREAALAFHLTHRWKKTKILTEYLNSVYFGNGAYGVEQAARVYFGSQLGYDANAATDGTKGGCGNGTPPNVTECASRLNPAQAALLAGMIASPGAFNPATNPAAAKTRRELVLKDMLTQRYISRAEYEQYVNSPLPTSAEIEQPAEPSAAPYFTSWLRPQILAVMGDRPGASQQQQALANYRAFYGGLKIHTTLDLAMQQAADQAVEQVLPSGTGAPTASLVAIDNKTGEVRAMVGGPIINGREDYAHYPFNLATEGHRQPGSSFKPFTLAVALEDGISPDSVWTSAPQDFIVPNSGGKEHFIVHNFGNQYSGSISLQGATDVSDNSVFAQVGIKVGTKHVAHLARQMGIRSPVSDNYAMILGGLRIGVSPLDMAHAYETFATGGLKVYNPKLGDNHQGPIGIHEIDCTDCAGTGIPAKLVNDPKLKRILPPDIAQTEQQMLMGPVQSGTATQAAISGVMVAGKTGTTSNYADAWFVGWTPQLTVAVWVGFPDKLVPMNTLYNGGPVEGGTYPAIIWHSFMVQALQILQQEAASSTNGPTTTTVPTTVGPVTPAPIGPSTASTATAPSTTTPATGGATGTNKPTTPTTPAPAPTTPGGGNTGGTPGGGHTGGPPGGGTTGGTPGGGTGGNGGTTGGTGGTGIPGGK
jgi:penicillin-binding protein 1A